MSMFEQVIGNGANLFICIVAIIIGFIGAIIHYDSKRTKSQPPEE